MYYFENSRSLPARLAEKVLQLFFPMATYCMCCGKYVDSTRAYCICDHCIKHIRWGHVYIDLDKETAELGRQRVLDSAMACMKYGLYERRLIFDLKYDGLTYLARIIARIMADRVLSDQEACSRLEKVDYIVAVPVHREKLKTRGFNQTEKIGRHLAAFLKTEMITGCLERGRATEAQRSLSAAERFVNLEDAFFIDAGKRDKIKGKSILLIDDVYTSGATAWHCARALREGGAAEVHFMALATSNDFAEGYFPLEKNQQAV